MVRQIDMAWSDSSCTAKECAIPIQANKKLLSRMIAFWKYFLATSYFLQWKQQVPTANQLTGCEEQFSTRLCAQQQSQPVRPRSSRQVAQMGRISKQRGSFLMALRHSQQAAGMRQFWYRVLALIHKMLLFYLATKVSKMLSRLISSLTMGTTTSSTCLTFVSQIFLNHSSYGGNTNPSSNRIRSVPVMSWQSTNRLNASTFVGSLWMHYLYPYTALSLFSWAQQHWAEMKARQLSIFLLQQVCSSWSSREARHWSYCLLRSSALATSSWKEMLQATNLCCWKSVCTFLQSPFLKQHSPNKYKVAIWLLASVASLSAKKMASEWLCTLRLSMVSQQSRLRMSLLSSWGKVSSSGKWCSGC